MNRVENRLSPPLLPWNIPSNHCGRRQRRVLPAHRTNARLGDLVLSPDHAHRSLNLLGPCIHCPNYAHTNKAQQVAGGSCRRLEFRHRLNSTLPSTRADFWFWFSPLLVHHRPRGIIVKGKMKKKRKKKKRGERINIQQTCQNESTNQLTNQPTNQPTIQLNERTSERRKEGRYMNKSMTTSY